jgi:hypothetical protein
MARFAIVLLLVALFSQSDRLATACFANNAQCKPCFRAGSEPGKEIINKAPDVTDIELEKSELQIPPKENESENESVKMKELTISVKTTAEDPDGDVLTYNYTISGGRIVGTGANISWSLYGVLPGTYTITAGVDDGCGICGKTLTKSVTVSGDPSDPAPCECPRISILLSQPGNASGDLDRFTAKLTGKGIPKEVTYNWTISAGTLHSGQGTSSINVMLPEGHTAGSGTVTVQIGGIDPNCSCTSSSSISY